MKHRHSLLPGCAYTPSPVPKAAELGKFYGPGGKEKYRKVYLDRSWDGWWESLARWSHHCRLSWESRGLGKV